MHLVAIAWIYVVSMMALVEAFSPNGTVLGAVITFLLYGIFPLGIVLYILSTPARRRARASGRTGAHGHQARHPAGDAVATVREEARAVLDSAPVTTGHLADAAGLQPVAGQAGQVGQPARAAIAPPPRDEA